MSKKNIKFNVINSNSNNVSQLQTLTIKIDDLNITNVYSPPQYNISPQDLETTIDINNKKNIIMGDFNAHHVYWGSKKNNHSGINLYNFINKKNFSIINNEAPTRFANNTNESPLDLTLVSNNLTLKTIWSLIPDPGFSDHYPTMCTLVGNTNIRHSTFPRKNFRKANWTRYETEIGKMTNQLDLNAGFDDLHSIVEAAAQKSIPETKTNQIKPQGNPWWDQECSSIVKERRKAISNFRSSPNLQNFIQAKRQIALSKKQLNRKKKDSFKEFCGTLNRNTNITYIWNKIKKFGGTHANARLPIPSDTISEEILKDNSITNITPNFSLQPLETADPPFNLEELTHSLKGKTSSAPGMDEVNYPMLSHLGEKASNILLNIYNECLQGKPIPEAWKKYAIIPILKPNKDPNNPKNFRPIVLSSCYLKTLEIIIKNRLDWKLENMKYFNHFQTAYRKGMGTYNNIAYLTTAVTNAFTHNQSVLAVFLDIKSAYDHVDIAKLYKKLANAGITSSLNNLIFRINSNRAMFIRNKEGVWIGPGEANAGIPQGSPLSTILFNIYIRDLFLIIPEKTTILGYADDIILFTTGTQTTYMAEELNNSLKIMSRWLKNHNLNISEEKSKAVWFTKGRRLLNPPHLLYNNKRIPYTDKTKYLGIILHKNLKWTPHITEQVNKAQKGLNIIKNLTRVWWGADPKTLLVIYNGIVKSHLDYGSIFIKPTNKTGLEKIDKTQFQSLRTILGCMKSTPTWALLAEAKEQSMDHRRKNLSVKFLLKIYSHNDHPLTTLLKNIRKSLAKNANFWRNKETPYLVTALGYLDKYSNKIYKNDRAPCYEMQLQHQIKMIKVIDLNLEKSQVSNKNLFYEITENIRSNHTFIYTDASKGKNNAGYGVYCNNPPINYAERLPEEVTICTAEIVAINKAIIISLCKELRNVVILSDSKSAIDKIRYPGVNTSNDSITLSTKKLLLEANNSGTKIHLTWIPSHTDISGNEAADKLANIGRSLNVPKNIKIDKADILAVIKHKLTEEFSQKWKTTATNKGGWYSEIVKKFPKTRWFDNLKYARRKDITNIIRLKTGHCRTKVHLNRIGIIDSPLCECGKIENINHIFLACPLRTYPQTDLYTKLVKDGHTTPFSMQTVLYNAKLKTINLINAFIDKNKLEL